MGEESWEGEKVGQVGEGHKTGWKGVGQVGESIGADGRARRRNVKMGGAGWGRSMRHGGVVARGHRVNSWQYYSANSHPLTHRPTEMVTASLKT